MKHWYGSGRYWRNTGRKLYNVAKWAGGRLSGATLGYIADNIPGALSGWELGGTAADWSGYYKRIKHRSKSGRSKRITGSNPSSGTGSNKGPIFWSPKYPGDPGPGHTNTPRKRYGTRHPGRMKFSHRKGIKKLYY